MTLRHLRSAASVFCLRSEKRSISLLNYATFLCSLQALIRQLHRHQEDRLGLQHAVKYVACLILVLATRMMTVTRATNTMLEERRVDRCASGLLL